jgi:tRNA dimethylallyltransferase
MPVNLITILGPTATGKTRLAAQLAFKFNGEIISADSRQVYKGMDIGSGKDLDDYLVEDKSVKYHMVDILSPAEEFNVYLFKKYFKKALNEITGQNKIPFLAGGTGLYISAVIQDYKIPYAEFSEEKIAELEKLSNEQLAELLIKINPKQHNTTDLVNRSRMIKAILVGSGKIENEEDSPEINPLIIGIKLPRELVRERITERLKARLETGLIKEVEDLIASGVSYKRLFEFGLEYKFIAKFIKGDITYPEMFSSLNTAIHQFSKRQMTWFRKMEREGVIINWIEGPDLEKASELIRSHNIYESST